MIFRRLQIFYRVADWFYHVGLAVLGYLFIKGKLELNPDMVNIILVSTCSLAYGYSFNDIAENLTKQINLKELFLSFLPLMLGLMIVFRYYPGFIIPSLLGIILNTIYSMPKMKLKTIPVLSIAINSFMFGIIFLLGAYVASRRYTLPMILMCIYIGIFFIPAQLLHELSHAQKDNRYEFIQKNYNLYLLFFIISISMIISFSIYLFKLLNLNIFFITSNILWIILFAYAIRMNFFKKFAIEKALYLRKIFRYLSLLIGFIYFLTFYKK